MKWWSWILKLFSMLEHYDNLAGIWTGGDTIQRQGSFDMTFGEYNEVKMWAPIEFWRMKSAERVDYVKSHGCGPGNIGDKVVPDTMYGLNVKYTCAIHDMMYSLASNEQDRFIADRTLHENLLDYIDAKTKRLWLRVLRRLRATNYYSAVRDGGKKYSGYGIAS